MKTVFAVTALLLYSLAFGESCPTGQVYDDCNRTMTGMCIPGCRDVVQPQCPVGQIYNACLGPQFGPGACVKGCVPILAPPPDVTGPTGPDALCITAYCHPVTYHWFGDFALAQSALGNGYSVMGSAGPCFTEDRSLCPDIFNQAFNDLRLKALQANRAMSWLSRE